MECSGHLFLIPAILERKRDVLNEFSNVHGRIGGMSSHQNKMDMEIVRTRSLQITEEMAFSLGDDPCLGKTIIDCILLSDRIVLIYLI